MTLRQRKACMDSWISPALPAAGRQMHCNRKRFATFVAWTHRAISLLRSVGRKSGRRIDFNRGYSPLDLQKAHQWTEMESNREELREATIVPFYFWLIDV